MRRRKGGLQNVLLGPGLELFERAYPEAITRNAPVWYDAGTSLSGEDVDYFRGLLNAGRRHLIAQRGWLAWPPAIQQFLAEEYQEENVGSRDVMYVPRVRGGVPAVHPVASKSIWSHFRASTESNVLFTTTRHSPNMELKEGPRGGVFGSEQNSNWLWPMGAQRFRGRAVAWLQPGSQKVEQLSFRILAGDGSELLWETPALLSPEHPNVSIPFDLQPGGKALQFQVVVAGEPSSATFAGWRSLIITQAGSQNSPPPLPYLPDLAPINSTDEEVKVADLWFGSTPPTKEQLNWKGLPVENWRSYPDAIRKVKVTAEFSPETGNPGEPAVVMLAWYRAGRLEILNEQVMDLQSSLRVTLEENLPEPTGWVGLMVKSVAGKNVGHRMRIISWDKW